MPTGGLGGWAPGAMSRLLPDGMGKFLRKGSDLVLQVHYHPDGKAETDQSVVGVYFTKSPVRKIVGGIAVRTRNLDIPPGERRYHATAQSDPLPVDVQAIGIAPHMHYIGKEMKVVAESPDGKTIPLIWIKDWDFNWQGQYQYQTPVKLTKGSVIKLDAYYDNSAENPSNPSKPPRRVRWGEQTTDEMCLLGVQVVTENLADLRKVVAMRGNRLGAALFGGDAGGNRLPAAARARLLAEGFPIPERFREALGRFDRNKDGKLTREEDRRHAGADPRPGPGSHPTAHGRRRGQAGIGRVSSPVTTLVSKDAPYAVECASEWIPAGIGHSLAGALGL